MRLLLRYLAWCDKPRHSSEKPLQASTLGSLQDRFNVDERRLWLVYHADRRAVGRMPSSPSTLLFSAAQALSLDPALLSGDGPDQDTEDRLGDDVRNRVPDLLASCCRNARDSHHLDDVHKGIGQPGNDRKPASVSRERCDRFPTCGGQLLRSCTQPNSELLHDIQEWNHGKQPPHPPTLRIVLDLAGIAKSHHDRRGDTQIPALGYRLLSWQPHDQDQLDEEERDCKNPVDISIGIIEGLTREENLILGPHVLHVEGIIPGIENSEVVVCRDGGHQPSDGQRRAVLFVHVADLEPEEDGRTSHPCNTERESVVHRTPACIVPSIDEGCHDRSRRTTSNAC